MSASMVLKRGDSSRQHCRRSASDPVRVRRQAFFFQQESRREKALTGTAWNQARISRPAARPACTRAWAQMPGNTCFNLSK